MILTKGVKARIVYSPDDGGSGDVLGQSSTENNADTSAGKQNTEDQLDDYTQDEVDVRGGKYIPRERFNQAVNKEREKAKALEERLQKAEQSSEAFNRIESYLTSNPNLGRKVNSLIRDHANGKLTEAQLEKELGKVEDRLERQDATYQKETHVQRNPEMETIRFSMYDNELMSALTKEYQDEEDIKDMGKRVTRILNSDYPQWKEKYYPGLAKKVLKEAIAELEGYHKKKMDSYQKKKQDDGIPGRQTSTGGFQEDVKLDTAEKRRASLGQGLKGALKGV
jgi:hypothetical protein